MAQVIILFEGYSQRTGGTTTKANCTCTLIKAERNIIVDTMTAWDGERIVQALASHGCEPKDISHVVCTHGHPDHTGCNYLFLEAEHIVGCTVHRGTDFFEKKLKNDDYRLCEGVRVTATPGHTAEDVSVLVDAVVSGECAKVAVTGDLFENARDILDPTIWQEVGDPELRDFQRSMRSRILEVADYVVPGHGEMFRVNEAMREMARRENGCVVDSIQ